MEILPHQEIMQLTLPVVEAVVVDNTLDLLADRVVVELLLFVIK
jgi:hypothetical protein